MSQSMSGARRPTRPENHFCRFYPLVHSPSSDTRWAIRTVSSRIGSVWVLSPLTHCDFHSWIRARKPILRIGANGGILDGVLAQFPVTPNVRLGGSRGSDQEIPHDYEEVFEVPDKRMAGVRALTRS